MPIRAKTARGLRSADREWTRHVRRRLEGLGRRMRDSARGFAPVDKGTFRRSIQATVRGRGLDLRLVVDSTDVPGKVLVIEFGNKTGTRKPRAPFQKARRGRRGLIRTFKGQIAGDLRSAIVTGF